MIHLSFGQTFVIGDGDFVLLSCTFVHCGHIEDTVGINVKGHLNLRDTSGSRWNTSQFKFPQDVIVLSHGPFTFIDLEEVIESVFKILLKHKENKGRFLWTVLYLNEHTRLVVWVGGKGLGLFGRDGGVPFDKDSHHSSSCFNSQG